MNIRDASNSYNSLQINPNANIATREEMPARQEQPTFPQDDNIQQISMNPKNTNIATREEMPARQEQHIERRDEYVQSVNVVNNALYSVSDVSQDRSSTTNNQIQVGRYYPDGEKVTGKIIDIILSMGIKKLSIFRVEA